MKFSIIIPVYKVEKYLSRCIESVQNQSYQDYEVILVDDGSPDNCPKMCDDIAKTDCRYKVIHKANQGLGYARNSGMELATGDYLVFIDSDDYIARTALDDIYECITRESLPDVCVFGNIMVDKNGVKVEKSKTINGVFREKEVSEKVLPKAFSHSMRLPYDEYGIGSAWGAVYNRQFLLKHQIKFLSERECLSEDLLFSIEICLRARSIAFMDKNLYYYCENGASLSHSYRTDRLNKSLFLYNYMNTIIEKNELPLEVKYRLMDNLFINLIICIKQEIHSNFKYKIKRKNIKGIINSEEFQKMTSDYPANQLPFQRRLLFLMMKRKFYGGVYLLFLLKERT